MGKKNFLSKRVKNIEMSTVPALAHFLGREPKKQREAFGVQDDDKYKGYIGKNHFKKCTVNLKEAVFRFIQENDDVIIGKTWEDFPSDFTRDLFAYTNENLKNALKNGKKRMEPSQNGEDEEEGHELKKTKKSDPACGN